MFLLFFPLPPISSVEGGEDWFLLYDTLGHPVPFGRCCWGGEQLSTASFYSTGKGSLSLLAGIEEPQVSPWTFHPSSGFPHIPNRKPNPRYVLAYLITITCDDHPWWRSFPLSLWNVRGKYHRPFEKLEPAQKTIPRAGKKS